MQLFRLSNRERNENSRRIWALWEIAYTCVDFGAALCFTVGSVLFFWKQYETAAIWFFTVGSVLFMAKPGIRLIRELHLLAMGDDDDLARRLRG
jgi:uncharacterized membrane protein YhfC